MTLVNFCWLVPVRGQKPIYLVAFLFFSPIGWVNIIANQIRLIEVLPKFAGEKNRFWSRMMGISLRYANLNNFKDYNSTIQPSDLTRRKTTTLSVKIEPLLLMCVLCLDSWFWIRETRIRNGKLCETHTFSRTFPVWIECDWHAVLGPGLRPTAVFQIWSRLREDQHRFSFIWSFEWVWDIVPSNYHRLHKFWIITVKKKCKRQQMTLPKSIIRTSYWIWIDWCRSKVDKTCV